MGNSTRWRRLSEWVYYLQETGSKINLDELVKKMDEIRKVKHKWDKNGERCLRCGSKDWMQGNCK